MRWQEVTHEYYNEQMAQASLIRPYGFLSSEPWYYTEDGPIYAAFVAYKPFGFMDTVYTASLDGITIREFLKLDTRDVEYDVMYAHACEYYARLEEYACE